MHAQSLRSCPALWDSMDCSPTGSSVHGDSPGKNTEVGCHALLQGIFQTQGWKQLAHESSANLWFIFDLLRLLHSLCLTLCDPMNCSTPVLFFTISRNLLKFMSVESVMLSNHLILCHPFLLLPSIFPSNRIFSNESALCTGWPKYWASHEPYEVATIEHFIDQEAA